ncbi:MAG: ABC transporter permease [Thermoplasmata archaeon]|nr:ABC transporter permease [Thermoplasmata archaeon]MCI4333543.1 ABC transporter permease [Thermoplasmata archaeon]
MTEPALRPSIARTFWVNAIFAPRTSLGFMRLDFVLGTIFIIPFTQMVFFAFVASLSGMASAVAFVVVGNAVATVTYSSVFSVCQTTDNEKEAGTMEHLLVSPANRFALYFGRGVVPILTSLATVTVALVYAVEVFHVPFSSGAYVDLGVSIVLTALAMVGFGLLLGGVALYLRTSIILGNIFLFLGLLLSGANFPLSNLPLPLQYIGDLLPLTWGIAAVRAALSGAPLSTLLTLWSYVAICAVASFGLAMALWKTFEHRALSTGSIARF